MTDFFGSSLVSALEQIESEALGVEYVASFTEYVYGAMCSVDVAENFVGALRAVVDRLGALGATDAEIARYRKTIDSAAELVERITEQSLEAASLVPLLLRASAFDIGLERANAQWDAATRIVRRIHRLWDRLTSLAVPIARRGAALSFAAAATRNWLDNQNEAVASSSGEGGETVNLVDRDTVQEVFDHVTTLLLAGDTGLERRETIRATVPKSTLLRLAGAVFHTVVQRPALLTVRPTPRLHRFACFSALADGTDLIEISIGKGDKLTLAERSALLQMGFDPPTRKASESNWRLTMRDSSLLEIPLHLASVMNEVLGCGAGERFEMATAHIPCIRR